ncbi:hypothetical protein [Seonamhaeicola sp.]|uniref:hypothetical protein n=1 Tax=Seonamhaeicola sp. TaxID=1912245 RepID=UPI0026201A6A|nr:hypothetical protein [Seonamhaeicola sp.]
MILNTTYQNKKHKQIIRDLVGSSFSFFESFRMKGIGSKRMIIDNVSPNLRSYLNTNSGINYANIELRKEGILLFLSKGFQNFTWAIPYSQLVVFKTMGTSIHGQGKFIHFKNNNMFRANKRFFDKMLEEKIRYEERYDFYNIR